MFPSLHVGKPGSCPTCTPEQGRPRHHRKSATGGVSAAGLAPVKPAVEGAILALHTPFAAAAGTSAASPGVQGEQFAAGPAPWAPAVQAEAGNGSEFVDARQRQYVRQDTVGTVYLTPNASPATSFDAEPARMGAPGGAAPSGRAQQQQAAQAEAGAGAEAEGPASAHEGSSRYSTSGDESQGSEEDVEVSVGMPAWHDEQTAAARRGHASPPRVLSPGLPDLRC